jgi:hypothetical protein
VRQRRARRDHLAQQLRALQVEHEKLRTQLHDALPAMVEDSDDEEAAPESANSPPSPALRARRSLDGTRPETKDAGDSPSPTPSPRAPELPAPARKRQVVVSRETEQLRALAEARLCLAVANAEMRGAVLESLAMARARVLEVRGAEGARGALRRG